MGHIREKALKEGGVCYQLEVRLKGHPILMDLRIGYNQWLRKWELNGPQKRSIAAYPESLEKREISEKALKLAIVII